MMEKTNKIQIHHDVGGIKGLCLIQPRIFTDRRGYFFESYNEQEFYEENLNLRFVQDNEVFSRSGVLRGMHVNMRHPQGKLIRVVNGKIFDVVIDLRKDSSSYKQCYGIELSNENKMELYIPEGMGHGYYAITDTVVQFKVTTHYIPNDEMGFSWRSKAIDVMWPQMEVLIQNDLDSNSPDLDNIIQK